MPFTAACPFCPTKLLNVPQAVHGASVRCPQCGNYFTAVPPDEAAPVRSSPLRGAAPTGAPAAAGAGPRQPAPDVPKNPLRDPGQRPMPASAKASATDSPGSSASDTHFNLWGVVGLVFGGAALLQASLPGIRPLSITLAGLGLAVVLLALFATLENLQAKDRIWLGLGLAVNGTVLALAVFAPHLLNGLWASGGSGAGAESSWQTVVARDQPQQVMRLGVDDYWADARTEAIRQDDVLIRVASLNLGSPPEVQAGPARAKSLLVHVQLFNLGHQRPIEFAGFGNDTHRPVLTCDGEECTFLEQRQGKSAKGAITFETKPRSGGNSMPPRSRADVLLIFKAPSGSPRALKLDLPAAAWGRQGACRLRIVEPFDATGGNIQGK